MRPSTAAALVAVAGLAVWAFAAPAQEEDGPAGRARFLDALSPGDRIEIPQYERPPGASPVGDEGISIHVLGEQEVRERSLTPEERAELAALLKAIEEKAEDRLVARWQELDGKARRHPLEVVEVGEDYVAFRGWTGGLAYHPERRIRAI